jgi:hypothetical protein
MTRLDAHAGWVVSPHFPSHPGEVRRRRPLWVSRRAPSLTRMSDYPTLDGRVVMRDERSKTATAHRGQAGRCGWIARVAPPESHRLVVRATGQVAEVVRVLGAGGVDG